MYIPSRNRNRRRLVLGALLSYVLAIACGLMHARSPGGTGAVGWYYSGAYAYPFGSTVAQERLPPGSLLLALNGTPVAHASNAEMYAALHTAPGSVNHLEITQPNGMAAFIALPVAAPSWSHFLELYSTRLLLGVAFVGIGCAAFAVRPYTMTAWALLLFCIILASNLFLNALLFYPPITLALCYEAVASGFPAAVGLHLALVFPIPHASVARNPRRLWWIYAGGFALGIVALVLRVDGRVSKWIIIAPVTAASLAVLIGRSFVLAVRERDKLTRQRAGVMLAGSIVGLGPTVVVLVLQSVLGLKSVHVQQVLWTMFAFPAALVYLTVRRESVSSRIAIRRATAYLSLFASAALLGWVVAAFLTQVATGDPYPLLWWAVLVAFGATGTLHAALWQRCSRRLDRWFYPKRAVYPDIIHRVSGRIRAAPGPLTVLDQLVHSVGELCEATSATAFLFTGANGDGAYFRSTAGVESVDTAVLAQTALMQRMIDTRRLVRRDSVAAYDDFTDMRDLALAVFDRLGAEVVLPLIGAAGVIGGLAVGPRVSGDVYDTVELEAMETVVACAAYALPGSRALTT